jgi:hypothetical protein
MLAIIRYFIGHADYSTVEPDFAFACLTARPACRDASGGFGDRRLLRGKRSSAR